MSKDQFDMPKNNSAIPLCHSKFLQDVTIALGRRSLKSLRHSNPKLQLGVSKEEVEGSAVERLDIEARNLAGRLVKIVLWEDGISWVYSRERTTKASSQPSLDVHANLQNMTAEDIALLVRTTLTDPQSAEKEWKNRAVSEQSQRR